LELAKILSKQAGLAIKARYEQQEKERIAKVPPVDRLQEAITTPLLSAVKHGGISPFHLAVRNIEHFRA
jgi:hypothetical protein